MEEEVQICAPIIRKEVRHVAGNLPSSDNFLNILHILLHCVIYSPSLDQCVFSVAEYEGGQHHRRELRFRWGKMRFNDCDNRYLTETQCLTLHGDPLY